MKFVADNQDPEHEQTTVLCELVAGAAPNVWGLSQEVSELRHQGIEVDDNNEPAPDNAHPNALATQTIGKWVTPTIFPRQEDLNCHSTKGVWREHSWQKNSEMTERSLFRMEFPEKWVRDVFTPATKEEISGDDITLKEFYVYLGCHFFMACFEGISDRILWWSPKPVSIWEGASFRLQKYTSLQRFISVTSAMRFTKNPSPSFLDRFHDVRQMFKNSMSTIWRNKLPPGSVSSMSRWTLFWTSYDQGSWVFLANPNSLGNDYHSIADGDEGYPVIYRIKIQEGKDRPKYANGKWSLPSNFEGENLTTGRK